MEWVGDSIDLITQNRKTANLFFYRRLFWGRAPRTRAGADCCPVCCIRCVCKSLRRAGRIILPRKCTVAGTINSVEGSHLCWQSKRLAGTIAVAADVPFSNRATRRRPCCLQQLISNCAQLHRYHAVTFCGCLIDRRFKTNLLGRVAVPFQQQLGALWCTFVQNATLTLAFSRL